MYSRSHGRGKWCLGHGVVGQAESLRTGHYVEAHLVADCFAVSHAGGKTLASLMPRCNLCRSIRRWHDEGENARRRAVAFRRQHAKRWVEKGRFASIEDALSQMDVGGCSVEALTQLIVDAIDEDCPGLCAYESDKQIIIHKIERVADLHIDVKDPREPFTIENIGILCHSCNEAKRDSPWTTFIYRRKAMLRAWMQAIWTPDYRRPEQGTLFD